MQYNLKFHTALFPKFRIAHSGEHGVASIQTEERWRRIRPALEAIRSLYKTPIPLHDHKMVLSSCARGTCLRPLTVIGSMP